MKEAWGVRRWSKWKIGHLWLLLSFYYPVSMTDWPTLLRVHSFLSKRVNTGPSAEKTGWCSAMVIKKWVTSEGQTVTEAMTPMVFIPNCLSSYVLSYTVLSCVGRTLSVIGCVLTSRSGCWVTAIDLERARPSLRETTCATSGGY